MRALGIGAALVACAIGAGCADDPPPAVAPPERDASVDVEDDAGSAADVVAPEVEAGTEAGTDAQSDAGPEEEAGPPPLPFGPRDRVGRPYVAIALVSMANREDYNAIPVEWVLSSDPGRDPTFGADFQAALVMLDRLDGVDDWGGGEADAGPDDAGVYPHELANTWVQPDVLVVDPNKPFDPSSYLDVEVNGDAHLTCGGRWFEDDALDKTLSFLVKKRIDGVSDGVSAPARPVTQTFPYLAAPF